ncbi:MAG: bifunctional 4-hydroxy-3-methylbut-2-enyl diphosphate reductase/30S ribosomal protein S1 [Clostridium sp.]|nr:bifunctional 4-hydroxy-3-methylbut-2-enyl diphosphate reductase/30S ribosomal protein S1 [Clostridium sp.]
MRNVILAKEAGFCFGVKRAVDETLKAKKQYKKNIYTLGPLIHNTDVVKYLEEKQIFAIELSDIDKLQANDVIIIRSHGVSKEVIKQLEKKGLIIINATCPFVTNIQKKVEKFSEEGYTIVIQGDENHPEVIGINGWCNNSAIITKDGSLPRLDSKKVCLVSQTTEKVENYNKTLCALKNMDIYLRDFNTICSATDVRQKSADELSKKVDAMIVIGGKHSSNTTKLFQISSKNCVNTLHIENASELPEEYINNKNFKKIGITAGASTPDWIIREVINIMQEINNQEQLELMNQYDKVNMCIGDEIEGEVASKTNEGIIVSIPGYGKDGIIKYNQLTAGDDGQEYAETLNKGDKIKAKIIKFNVEGYVALSRVEYEKNLAYEELEKLYNNEEVFDLKISQILPKGIAGFYKGVRIFVPVSQIDVKFIKDKEALKGQTLQVKLTEFSKENPSKIIASRRVIIEKEYLEKEEKAWAGLTVGAVVKAEVKRFTNFGAFADVNGIDGLIHLSQISWKHIKSAEDVLKQGDIIDVKIIDVDREAKKLSLSIKQLTGEPWSNVKEKYPEGEVVQGTVVRINDFGAFVELEPGLDALVHISKISHDRIEHPSQVLTVGEEVTAKILSVDEEKKRISLSIKDK